MFVKYELLLLTVTVRDYQRKKKRVINLYEHDLYINRCVFIWLPEKTK